MNKTVSAYMAAMGRKGGKVKGPTKKRSPEHYQKLAATNKARYAQLAKAKPQDGRKEEPR